MTSLARMRAARARAKPPTAARAGSVHAGLWMPAQTPFTPPQCDGCRKPYAVFLISPNVTSVGIHGSACTQDAIQVQYKKCPAALASDEARKVGGQPMQDSIHASPRIRWAPEKPKFCKHALILGLDADTGDPVKVLCRADDHPMWCDAIGDCARCDVRER